MTRDGGGPVASLRCALPHDMSGGPVLTERPGVCGAWSSALAPYADDDPWTSYLTLLHPMLEFEVPQYSATVQELVADGRVTIGSLPAGLGQRRTQSGSLRLGTHTPADDVRTTALQRRRATARRP